MARPLVPDELWEIIEPLLPRHKARPGKRGRPPVDDRACLTGIIFVLQSGIPWWMLPQEMGCGSGVTCWRRLRYWQRRGVWKKLLHALLDRLGREGLLDWSKAVVDSQSYRAVFGGFRTGPNPRDRAKKGSKRHLLVDGKGTPLAVEITGAQRNESLLAMPLLDDVPPIRQPRGGRRRRPDALYGDRQYGTPRNQEGLKRRRIEDHLARPRTPHGSGLGKIRWVVERTLSWVGQARRLKIRYEKLPAVHRAFHYLQLARICCKILQRDF
ncbi:MAG TPA: IS5 family transposase [Isosphaeraceae bacterium]|nr:IS5 family transposase [Isosphaeraceae bacterium]